MYTQRILQRRICFVSWSISTRLAMALFCTAHQMRRVSTAAALRYLRPNTSGVTPNGTSIPPARGLVLGAKTAVGTSAVDGARATDSEAVHVLVWAP